jgi:hypothetical protein
MSAFQTVIKEYFRIFKEFMLFSRTMGVDLRKVQFGRRPFPRHSSACFVQGGCLLVVGPQHSGTAQNAVISTMKSPVPSLHSHGCQLGLSHGHLSSDNCSGVLSGLLASVLTLCQGQGSLEAEPMPESSMHVRSCSRTRTEGTE